MLAILLLVSAVYQIGSVDSSRDNVCSTLWDYVTVTSGSNPNCWYNPNVRSNLRDIVQRNGYPLEEHHITTEDGYILVVFRILSRNSTAETRRQPVIIQHGIQGSATFWVLQNRKSLGLFFVDQGYDVWLPTLRGSTPSTKHVSLSERDPEYWEFGLDELALYDLVSIVEYVANVTSQKGNIIYVGHSMGSTISYIYASERSQHAKEHLKGIISLAPIAFLDHLEPLVKRVIVRLGPVAASTIDALGIKGSGQIPFGEDFFRKFCGLYPVVVVCDALLKFTSGVNPKENQSVRIFLIFFS
nr:unnamed protein product [Callosobruchus chinensis]